MRLRSQDIGTGHSPVVPIDQRPHIVRRSSGAVRSNPGANRIRNGVRTWPCRGRRTRIAGLTPTGVASAPNATRNFHGTRWACAPYSRLAVDLPAVEDDAARGYVGCCGVELAEVAVFVAEDVGHGATTFLEDCGSDAVSGTRSKLNGFCIALLDTPSI